MNAKEYMSQVRVLRENIGRMNEELARLRSGAMEVGSISMAKPLRRKDHSLTVMEDMTVTRVELEQALKEETEYCQQVFAEIESTIHQLGQYYWRYGFMLENYYLWGFSFTMIAKWERQNVRTVYKHHSEALVLIQRILDEREKKEGGDAA